MESIVQKRVESQEEKKPQRAEDAYRISNQRNSGRNLKPRKKDKRILLLVPFYVLRKV